MDRRPRLWPNFAAVAWHHDPRSGPNPLGYLKFGMDSEPVETIIGYHERTKHHPGRYARSLGYLDWATQPDPFRRFDGATLLKLPIPPDRDQPTYEDVFTNGAIPPRRLTVESVSEFFYLSLALSAWKEAGASRWPLRVNPSSGNLHPTEGYAILPGIEGLTDTPAVCHYAPREHALERRAQLSRATYESIIHSIAADPPPDSIFLVGLTSIYWREAWKYGERAFRYCNHDVGHALAALRIAAAVLGWRLIVLEDLSDFDVAGLLGVDRADDFDGAEREEPDVLAVVLPADCELTIRLDCDADAIEAVAQSNWSGHANPLSSDHVDWDIIDAAHDATSKPRSSSASIRLAAPPANIAKTKGIPAYKVIRNRRSALAFDGGTGMPARTFYRMLERIIPRSDSREGVAAPVPWDTVQWPPRIHLFMFVHLVEGLAPGIYAIIRDPRKIEEFKKSCDPQFAWSAPADKPSELPLFQLMQADCRRAAAQLSLGQDIAGTSALSLAMVADFDDSLRGFGAWYYRRLFWEAGMIGQILYLEAEAVGLRATGIGAYFDDLVHETLGFSGRRFQSLYHFTLGGTIEDLRILTEPAYPASPK